MTCLVCSDLRVYICSNCIIDKNARIGRDVIIKNKDVSPTNHGVVKHRVSALPHTSHPKIIDIFWFYRALKKPIDPKKGSTSVRGSL